MSANTEALGTETVQPKSLRLLQGLAKHILRGRLMLRLPDGSQQVFEGPEPGPSAELHVIRPRFVRRVLTGGSTGFAETYLDGDCDTPDLAAFLELAALNYDAWERIVDRKPVYRFALRLLHIMRPNTRRGAKRNIAKHYDLGNDFYRLWLDETMTYSSAVFDAPETSLNEAQHNKYRRIAQSAGLRPDGHVLEIGCGWGGFAEFAAREIGARVTAVTISDAQFAYAKERIQRAGLNERVEIRRQDYRDIDGTYDHIASIEMFEAVGERYWPVFFSKLRERLKPGGQAALQVITIADEFFEQYRRSTDFIQRHIFPGGMLPSPDVLKRQVRQAGLDVRQDNGFGLDYARTLADWHRRFDAAWPQIATLGYDERFARMWRYYLAYCKAGFLTGRIDVRQIALTHG